MLRAFLFIAAITCAAGSAPAQELDGRLKQIYETGTIKLAYRSDANPFSFVSPQGQPDGYTIDLCKFIASSLERQLNNKLTIEWVPVELAKPVRLNRCRRRRHRMRLKLSVVCSHDKGRFLQLHLYGKYGSNGTDQFRNF